MADFDLSTVLSAIGITQEITTSILGAVADPTSANLQAVVRAYANNGQVPPTKIMAYLIKINEERYPEDTYRGASFPWLFAGAGILAYFLFSKRRGRSR
jgi:hypothetical protein